MHIAPMMSTEMAMRARRCVGRSPGVGTVHSSARRAMAYVVMMMAMSGIIDGPSDCEDIIGIRGVE